MNDETVMISLTMPAALKAKIQKQADEQHRSFAAQMRFLLERAVKDAV